ncbi:MAG: response regulator [Clostridiales bacterium]|nr:response regulator [Clostridiales bacterium]
MYKVLLVEDEEMIMKSMQFLVNWTGLSCVVCGCAHNGREGIQMIHTLHPDIVITDIRMPFVDGLKMLEETKTQCDYEAVIMSGYEEFDYAKKAIRLGVTDYLLKPMDVKEMEQTIQNITRQIEEKKKLQQVEAAAVRQGEKLLVSTDLPMGSARYVTKMVEYIQEKYTEKVSIRDIAEQSGISIPYLHVKFKEATGYTFNDFLNRYRIQQALRLMTETDMRIYEIAQAVGIQDYKYFNQVFKKYTGMSPSHLLNGQQK